MSQFQQPGISNPEDKFAPHENNGALLLFFPTAFQAQVKTAHGDTDAVTARVVRLNDGRVYDNAMIFSTALVTQLKSAIPDGMVLGTLGQGVNTKGSPPWLLSPHTEADVAMAEQWLAANPRISQPPVQAAAPASTWGAPAVPPTQGGWGAPATPAAPQWGGQAPAPAAPAQYSPVQAQATGNGWGAPAPAAPSAPAPEQGQFPGQWGGAAPVAPPVQAPPVQGAVDPGLVAALMAKGIPVTPGMTQAAAEGIWAVVGGQ